MQEEKKKKKKNGDLFFVFVMLVMCICIVGLVKGNAPAVFGYRILHVISGSMEPEIETGSYIIIRETDSEYLKVGDVITFISEEPAIYGMYNTHRIYDICNDTYTGEKLFITKGDAYTETDAYPVGEDQIVGKLVKVLPLGKSITKILSHLSNNHVYLGIIILPMVICLISYVVQLIKTIKEKDEDETE